VTTLRKTFKRYKRQVAGVINRREREVSRLEAKDKTAALELVMAGETCRDWVGTKSGRRITFVHKPVLTPRDRVFTMGSCFAVEIRKALLARGFDTYPKYSTIEFNRERQTLAKLPERDNVNHYNTFVIRQEFELALGTSSYGLGDLVDLGGAKTAPSSGKAFKWQDPYRKSVFATDDAAILDLSGKITGCIRSAIQTAEVYIITLGLTEVWKNNANGLFINQAPRAVDDRVSFVESTYEQNHENIHRVAALIAEHYPHKRIILTVSPVPLSRTFTSNDIVVANMESKSILRAVAARVSKQMDNVTYWPSYEIALARDIFEDDGRHVRAEGIDLIVDQFLKVHT
jgi:hypothetical protein